MKLDLLYEVQAPKPWPDKPYPYDQREAEHAEVEGAVVVVMQQSLPGHVVQTPTSTRLC